jgi:UDP-glucuronate 4-epimerase
MKIIYLVTGCAGFIGFHLEKNLLRKKNLQIVGLDSLNEYYDKKLKLNRLKQLKNISKKNNFLFYKINLVNKKKLDKIRRKYLFQGEFNNLRHKMFGKPETDLFFYN